MAQRRARTASKKSSGQAGPRKPSLLQFAVFVMLLGAACALWVGRDHMGSVFAAFNGAEEPKNNNNGSKRGVPVVVDRAGSKANDIYIDAIATARAKRFVTLYPEVSGEVIDADLHAGDRVKSGEIVLKLDSKDAELAVELAKVRVEEAQLALDRSQRLLERNVNSAAKVQDAKTVLERAKIELRQAREALSKRTLRAPFDGVLGIPKVERGDRITSQTPVVTVDDRSELLVEIEVPEENLAHIAPGQTVTAKTPSFPNREFKGKLDRIDSRVMPASRTVMVRAVLPNEKDLLRPGMSFAVELTIPGKDYPTVPELALQWSKGKSYVWRVDGDTVTRVEVRSIKRLNRIILVEGDLKEGDLVVVEGVQRLRPGRKVTYTLPESKAGA